MLSKNQVKEIQLLHQKKQRDRQKLFIVEGLKAVAEVIETKPELFVAVYGINSFISANKKQLSASKTKIHEVSQVELEKLSLQQTPNSALAVCRYFESEKFDFDFTRHFSLYLDGINDPGNFGTILRLADWFGISTIFCSSSSCDIYNPKVIQASMGAFLRVKVVYKNLRELIDEEKIKTVYGAVLNGKNIYEETLKNGLIVIGNEARGISAENINNITQPIRIPAHKNNGSESLNAAMAASIIVAEFFRNKL